MDFYQHPSLDLNREIRTVMIVDDDPDIGRMLGLSIQQRHPSLVCAVTTVPKQALDLFQYLYFDMLISDINMPGIQGDQLLDAVRHLSPTTFTMAMTGLNMDSAYLAGRARPDFFLDKNRGFKALLDRVQLGIEEALKRRTTIIASVMGDDLDPADEDLKIEYWRDRKKVADEMGFSPREIRQSAGIIKAILMLRSGKPHTRETIAFLAGFSSFQRLRLRLEKLQTILSIPLEPSGSF